MKRKLKILAWAAAMVLALFGIAAGFWVHRFRNYTPAQVKADFKAAIGARNAPQPVEKFLELRYGPLSEAENRQRAFLDFFNPSHIQALQVIVHHTPEGMKQSNNQAMADWIANYRRSMTPEEKDALGLYFRSDDGRLRLQQATAHYLRQDAHYRASTAAVIRELMSTVAAVQAQ